METLRLFPGEPLLQHLLYLPLRKVHALTRQRIKVMACAPMVIHRADGGLVSLH